jgi:drug/metabolite transporter (DMT)-like permease
MVALADDDSSIPAATAPLPRAAEALAGDALCVGSAAAYSIYTVMMQARLQEDDTDAPALLFGCIGLLTALAGLPVLAVAAARGALAGVTQVALGLAVLNGAAAAAVMAQTSGPRRQCLGYAHACFFLPACYVSLWNVGVSS